MKIQFAQITLIVLLFLFNACLNLNSPSDSGSTASSNSSSSNISSSMALSSSIIPKTPLSSVLSSSSMVKTSLSSSLVKEISSSSSWIKTSSSSVINSSDKGLWSSSSVVKSKSEVLLAISAANLFLQKVDRAMNESKDFGEDFSFDTKPYAGARDPYLDTLWNSFPGTITLCVQMENYTEWSYSGASIYDTDSVKIQGASSSYLSTSTLKAFSNLSGGLEMGKIWSETCQNESYKFLRVKSFGPYPSDSLAIERMRDHKKLILRVKSGLV